MSVEIFETVALYRSVVQSKALLFRGDHDSPTFCFNKDMNVEAYPKGLTGDCWKSGETCRVDTIVLMGKFVYLRSIRVGRYLTIFTRVLRTMEASDTGICSVVK
jgi:hypothetical protein